MAGMDACLSVSQARAQQERICASDSHQGSKKSSSTSTNELTTKIAHQGK